MKRIDWRKCAWIAGVIIVIWVTIGIILAGNEPGGAPPGSTPIVLRGGRVTGNRISTRSWDFSYSHAQMSPDGMLATIQGVKHGVLYRKGKPYLGLSAQQVTVNTQTFDFTAIGDVHIAALNPKDGIPKSFDTDFVQWNNAGKMLLLTHPSIVKTGDQVLKVSTINVNFNTNDVQLSTIKGGVEAPL